MQPIHDIRQSIPLTDQTNPAKFKPWEFVEYPKMMLNERNEPYLDMAKQPVIVNNKDEEDAFRKTHPKAAQTVSVDLPAASAPAAQSGEIARLEAENERMRKLLAERSELESKLGTEAKTERKKPGPKPKAKPAPVADLPPNLT